MKKIVVLKGGNSPEREVSLVSGREIATQLRNLAYDVLELDPADYPDLSELVQYVKSSEVEVVFNGLHGGSGEDGQIQAVLSSSGIPFTGSGFVCCAITMDKYVTKLIVQNEGIPVPDGMILRDDLLCDYQSTTDLQGFEQRFGLPLVVKPNAAGSSVGIHIVNDLEGLKPAVLDAFNFGKTVLVERYITGRELTVTVLAGKALPVVEIKPKEGFYDYKNKYSKGNTIYEVPATLSAEETELIQLYAQRIWKACYCHAYARIDFRYDGEQFYFLEVNTLPGMTPLSLSPMAAKAANFGFGEFLTKIIEESLRKTK